MDQRVAHNKRMLELYEKQERKRKVEAVREVFAMLTEEEAMEYLVKKDLPPRVWRDYRGNRTILKIVPRALIPTDRSNRNAWRLDQVQEAA